MPRFGSHWLQLVRLASILVIAATTSRADRPVWAGTGSGATGNANNSTNWLSTTGNSVIPSTSDLAVIDHGKATFSSNTSLGGIALTGNTTTNTTGSIDGTATLTLVLSGAAGSTWDAGTISFSTSGSALVSSSGSLTIQSSNSHVLFGGAIKNQGTTTWTGGTINGGNAASIVNDTSGTFEATTDGTFAFDQGGSQPMFDNKGTFRKSGSTGGETNIAASFSNTGTVNVTAGRLTLHGGGTGNGTFSVSGTGSDVVIDNGYTLTDGASIAGAVRLTGGTLTASGNISANGLSLEAGSFRGTQTLKGGTVTWSGGDWNSADATTVAGDGTLTIGGAGDHDFNARTLANNGTVNWTGGRLRSGNGGSFTNNGTFNDSASSTVNNDLNTTGGTALAFTNASGAHYNKSAAGTTTYDVEFDNNGTVSVTGGRLTLHGGGTSAGTLTASGSGSDIVIDNGYALSNGASVNGPVRATGGTLTANGTITANGLSIEGATLAGNHTFSGGSVSWSSGNINASGTTTIDATAALTISGTVDHDFNARAIANNGTVNWTGGRLLSGTGGTFTNAGTFNDSASGDVNNDGAAGTAPVFTNAATGTYNKTTAGNTTFYVALENSGTVNIGNGTLDLHGGGTLHGGATLHADNGANVVFSGDYSLADASSLTGPGNFAVTAGTFTATGNVNVNNFAITGGHLAGNQTFKGSIGWSGGDLNNGDKTTVDTTATLTISGTADHDFSAHQVVNNGTTNWSGGRLRSGNGGALTNNGTFVDSASSEINNDFGGTASLVFTNAAGATYRKTAAGNTTVSVPFVNSGALDIQDGALVLNANSTFNNGSTTAGNGTLRQSAGVLTANGVVTFANLQIAGGSVDGTHTLGGAVTWSGGDFNNGGSTTIGGNFTIDTAVDHDFSAHQFDNSGTIEWVAGAGRLRSGNGGKFQNDGVFNDSASSTWNNDYLNAAAEFRNGATGTYNKKAAGTTTFDGVTLVNAGTINVTAGSLDIQGGGSSPAGAHFNASSGASLRFTGGNFAVADGAAFAGTGHFAIVGGNTTIGATVSAADFELSGGTLGGTQTFTGGLSWKGGNMNDAGTTTTIGAGGNMTIDSNVDHDFSAHGIVNDGTINWNAGRLRSGNGGSIVNNGTFNDTSGSVLNNDYLNATVTFTNAAGGTYRKGGGNTSTYAVPFNNNGTIDVSSGILSLTAGGTVGNGAAFHGSGAVSLAGGVFTASGTFDSTSLVIDGAQIAGTHGFTGNVTWNTGNFNTSGNTTIDGGGTLAIATAADHDFSGHAFVNNGTIAWNAGRLRSGNGGSVVNNGTFDDAASSEINNDYLNTTLVFTNAVGGNYNKSGAGNTDVLVPFNNNGTVNVSAGTLVLHNGGAMGNGAAFYGHGTTQLVGGTFIFNGSVLSDSLVLTGATLGGTPILHGLVTFQNGLLGSGAASTVASDGVFEMTTSADHDLPGHAFVNNGTVNWRGGRIRGGNSATITNNGVFNDYASSEVNNDYLNTTLTFTNATSGVYNKLGAGTTTFAVPFTNNGTLNVRAGTMVFNGAFTNQGSLIFANGASAQFSGPLTFASTTLAGTGSIIAPAVTAGALVSPGNSPGMLTISGDFTMLTSAVLLIDLGGTTQGTSYDYLNVGGSVTLAGLLNLRFANGFESSILSSDSFTILSSGGTGGLTGAFANVSSGQRLLTMDGMGSFQVNYGAGLNSVTLSNFQAIPEPDTYALMGMGVIALAVVMRRRRARVRR